MRCSTVEYSLVSSSVQYQCVEVGRGRGPELLSLRLGRPARQVPRADGIFKASALWANAFYKSKCLYVCLSVRLSVCSLLRYLLNVFLPPLPKVGCPIFLEI